MTSVSVVSAAAARIRRLLLAEESESKSNSLPIPESLQSDLEEVSQKLEEVRNKQLTPSDEFIKLEREIIRIFYEIDNAIAQATAEKFKPNPKAIILSKLPGGSSAEKTIQNLSNELRSSKSDIQKYADNQQPPSDVGENSTSKQGIDSAAARPPASAQGDLRPSMEKKLRSAMLEKNWPVVCICGESGMGKSILVKKAYYDVRHRFNAFAWVPISGDFHTTVMLQNILLQLQPNRKADVRGMDDIDLAQEILNVWKDKRCLVVLEDVDEESHWKDIRAALPTDESISKFVIITTSKKVAKEAAVTKERVFQVKPLAEDKCIQILKTEADFNDEDWNNCGRKIHKLSKGSPLTALTLGKSLKTRDAAARAQLLDEFNSSGSESVNSDDGDLPVLRISYRCLPHEKKPCFLYMGQFPENHEIPVETLYLLLAAEDLASSTEEVTESLVTICDFGLVDVQEDVVSKTRTYKSCRLHKKIKKLSIWQGVDEDFSENIEFDGTKWQSPGYSLSSKLNKYIGRESIPQSSRYRLSLYLNKNYGESNPFAGQDTVVKKIRCLLIFDADPSRRQKPTWQREINDLKDFTALRILYVDGVDFRVRKVPTGIGKLVLLRYLSFRGCFLETFPQIDMELPCLETLDLRVSSNCKMNIPDIISKMKKLRHLYFPKHYQSENENGKLSLSGLELLEVLVNFDTGVCNVEDLYTLKNVQILTAISEGNHRDLTAIVAYLYGNPENLKESSLDIRNIDCYSGDRVKVIEELLECKSLHGLRIKGEMDRLPKNIGMSETISELELDGLELEDDPMDDLGKAVNLRSLVLVNDACIGDEMTFRATSKFANLRVLKVKNLQYLDKLTFEREAMPKLSTLVIKNCSDLKEVWMPSDLNKTLEECALEEKRENKYSVEPLPSLYA